MHRPVNLACNRLDNGVESIHADWQAAPDVVDQVGGPEVRAQAPFRDRCVGAVRAGHPVAGSAVTAAAYASTTDFCNLFERFA